MAKRRHQRLPGSKRKAVQARVAVDPCERCRCRHSLAAAIERPDPEWPTALGEFVNSARTIRPVDDRFSSNAVGEHSKLPLIDCHRGNVPLVIEQESQRLVGSVLRLAGLESERSRVLVRELGDTPADFVLRQCLDRQEQAVVLDAVRSQCKLHGHSFCVANLRRIDEHRPFSRAGPGGIEPPSHLGPASTGRHRQGRLRRDASRSRTPQQSQRESADRGCRGCKLARRPEGLLVPHSHVRMITALNNL